MYPAHAHPVGTGSAAEPALYAPGVVEPSAVNVARQALTDEPDAYVEEARIAETDRDEIIEQIDDQRRLQGASLLRIYH